MTSNSLYDPFGKLLQHQGVYDRFGFTGEWSGATGLQYLRARWYDAGSGRFTQVDPFAGYTSLPGTQHPYAYGLNNPLRYRDPSGEVFVESVVGGTVVGAAFGGIGYVINNPGQSLGAYVKSAEFWKAVGVGAVSGAAAGAVAALAVSGLGLLGLKAVLGGIIGFAWWHLSRWWQGLKNVPGKANSSARTDLLQVLRNRVRQLAGFSKDGTPLIVDNSVGVNPQDVAAGLRNR